MSFNMLKAANEKDSISLDDNLVQQVKQLVGHEAAFAILEGDASGITAANYQQWLQQIKKQATAASINLNKKASFEDVAYAILDKEPVLNTLSGDKEHSKQRIVNILWRDHKNSNAHNKLVKHLAKSEENEEQPFMVKRAIIQRSLDGFPTTYFAGIGRDGTLLWTQDPNHAFTYKNDERANDVIEGMLKRDFARYPNGKQGHLANEPQYNFAAQEVEKPSRYEENEDTSSTIDDRKMHQQALHAASYAQGKQAAKTDYDKNNFTSKNPYANGSFRYDQWNKGYEDYERTTWSSTVEDEEYNDKTYAAMQRFENEGREACERAHMKGYDANNPVQHIKCPYDEGTMQHTLWSRGYKKCMGQFDEQGY